MGLGRRICAVLIFGCTLGGAQACAFWDLSDFSTPEGSDAGSLEASADDRQSATDTGVAADADADAGADAGPLLALDTFTRTLATGLGSADTGGAWTLNTVASTYAVQDGAARFTVDTARSVEGFLLDVSALDVDTTVSFATSKTPDGNGIFASISARIATNADCYRLTVRVATTTVSAIELQLRDGTALTEVAALQISNAPGRIIRMRMQVQGSTPSHLRGRTWMDGTAEPSTWDVEASDSTAQLQSAGAIGLVAYVSGLSTVGPVVASFDDFVVAPLPPP